MIRAYTDGQGDLHVDADGERSALCAEAAIAVAAVTEKFTPADEKEADICIAVILEIAESILADWRRNHARA